MPWIATALVTISVSTKPPAASSIQTAIWGPKSGWPASNAQSAAGVDAKAVRLEGVRHQPAGLGCGRWRADQQDGRDCAMDTRAPSP